MSFYNKYLKYKQKYLELKNQYGRGGKQDPPRILTSKEADDLLQKITEPFNERWKTYKQVAKAAEAERARLVAEEAKRELDNPSIYIDKLKNSKCLELLGEIYTADKIVELNKPLLKKHIDSHNQDQLFHSRFVPGYYIRNKDKYPAILHPFFNIEVPILTSNDFYIKDPFFEFLLYEDVYKWYLEVNPEFKPMKDNKRSMIEYKTLIATMIKNLLCSILLQKLCKIRLKLLTLELLEKIKTLINEIETMLNKDIPYLYVDIISIIKNYMLIFESDIYIRKDTPAKIKLLEEIEAKKLFKCEYEFEIFDILLNSPYIIFPTFYMHNYMKVILNMRIPLINFYLTNNDHAIHDMTSGICAEIYHDIRGHYYIMNLRIFDIIFRKSDPINSIDNLEQVDDYLNVVTSLDRWRLIIDEINKPDNIIIVQSYFEFFNKIIEIILKSIQLPDPTRNYDCTFTLSKELYNSMWPPEVGRSIDRDIDISIKSNKFVPLLLFYYLHESYILYSVKDLNADTIIEYLTSFYKDITSTIPIICTGNNYYNFLNKNLNINTSPKSPKLKLNLSDHTGDVLALINSQVHKVLQNLKEKIKEQFP